MQKHSSITITPNAGFTQPVTFSCGGLPVGAACSFNPASVTPAGGPINPTLTISSNGGAVALLPGASPTMFAWLLPAIGLIPIGFLARRRGTDHRLLGIPAAWLIALAVIGTLSCSNSDSSPPPPATNSGGGPAATGTSAGTSNVTVTANFGSGSSGVPVTLVVPR
ncbi:MAG: hypothetical protein P0111_17320 [Nitrospira sp.]|nr:hypothetical protein [Nitrospira sp.]